MLESDVLKTGQFYIKVRIGNYEIEVAAPDKDFVSVESERLIQQFKLDSTAPSTADLSVLQGEVKVLPDANQLYDTKPETLAEFFSRFSNLQTNLDKILVLGYWCEVKQHQTYFTEDDIATKYKEIREKAPANLRRDLNSLTSKAKAFLMISGKTEDGTTTYSLTNRGIKEVESKMTQS